jgi:hypothetical protein
MRALVAVTLALTISCGSLTVPAKTTPDQSSAEAVLRSLYTALAERDAEAVVGLVRAKDGGELAAAEQRAMRDGLDRTFASGPIRVTAVRVLASRPLDTDAARLLPPNVRGAQLIFEVDGSGNACVPLPIVTGTAPFAEIGHRWYALEDVHFGVPFTTLPC